MDATWIREGVLLVLCAVCVTAQAESSVQVSGRGTETGPPFSQLTTLLPGIDSAAVTANDGASSANAYVGLSTGQIRVDLVSAFGNSGFNSVGRGEIADTLFIVGNLPSAANGILTFSVDGTISGGGGPVPGSDGNSGLMGAHLSVQTQGIAGATQSSFFASDTCSGYVQSSSSCQVGNDFAEAIVLPFTVDDTHRAIAVSAMLLGQAFNGAHVDFSHTGTLSISLPDGLTFASASGLLLTSPVPEPTPFALLLAGLSLLFVLRSNRPKPPRSAGRTSVGNFAHRNVASRFASVVAACCVALVPLVAQADATARAYLGDERNPGQVQPPLVSGAVDAISEVGNSTDTGYAYASANLSAGTLRVVGSAVYAPPYVTTTDAVAGISDSVTFAGGSGLTAYLDYSFDGSLGIVADTLPKAAFAQMFVNVATVGGSSSVYETLSGYVGNCGLGTNCVVDTSTSRTGSLAFQIFPDTPASFSMSLSGFASIGNSFDFGNTAKFYLRVPTDVTYTSASGAFLAAATPILAVPEPAAPVLLLTGLLSLVSGAGIRHKSTFGPTA